MRSNLGEKRKTSYMSESDILDLKESRVPIQDEWVELPNNKKVKKYFLDAKDIKKIKRKLNANSSS